MSIAAGSRGRRYEQPRAGDMARNAARNTARNTARVLTEDLRPGKIKHRIVYVRVVVALLLVLMMGRTGYLQTIGSAKYR